MYNLRFPLRKTYNNMLLTKDGKMWAYYKISPKIISRANKKEQEQYKKNFTKVLDNLTRYKDIHFQMLPKDMKLEERFKELEKDFDKEFFEVAKYYSEETIHLLKQEFGMVTQYDFYVGVRLDVSSENNKSLFKEVIVKTESVFINLLNLEKKVLDEYFEKYDYIERKALEELSVLDVRRLTEDELNYIVRFNFLGTSRHDVENESKKRGALEIANSVLDNSESSILKIENDNNIIYKSHLVLDSTDFFINNIHIFERLQSLPFPLEIGLKLKTVEKGLFDLKLETKSKQFKNEIEDNNTTNNTYNDDLGMNMYLVNELIKENDQRKNFYDWLLVITLSDTNKERLKKYVKIVKEELSNYSGKEKGRQTRAVAPVADQLQLFYILLHGENIGDYKNWLQLSTSEGISELLFGVTQRLGTNLGFYLGRIDKYLKSQNLNSAIYSSRDIVLFHQMLANKGIIGAKTDSPHIAITGKTGNGKSFLAKLLYIYSLLLDIKGLYFDPKSEMENWIKTFTDKEENRKQYPLFIELMDCIKYLILDYTKEEYYGILDPIVFLDGEEAKELAQEMFLEIINVKDKLEIETAILESIRSVVDRKTLGETVGSLHVIEELQNYKDSVVQAAGNNLYEKTQNGMLKLLVYDGSNKTISLKNKSTILQVYGLDLPKATDSVTTYTPTQKNSILIMQLLGKFMGKFGSNHKEQTMIFFDEGWTLTVSSVGQAIKKQLERIGRSMNNALIFITQLTNDIKDENGIAGNYGCIFAFDEDQDRENILDLLNLENNTTNYTILENTVKGQCLFRDFYGRVSKLSVHCLFDEWIEVFKTVEKTEVAYAEERYN